VNIIVFVKQVPDTASKIVIQKDDQAIVEDDIKWVMNPYDEFAIEEALTLKEAFGGDVTVISLGPERVKSTLLTALAMGADKGVFITGDNMEGLDAVQVAKALAKKAMELDYDLIFTGQRGVDADQGIVGSMVAAYLKIPIVSLATKVNILENQKTAVIERTAEERTEIIESGLPLLITAEKGLNEPRYATMRRIMMARKKPLEKIGLGDLGLDQAAPEEKRLNVVKLLPPKKREAGIIIEGETPQAKALELGRIMRDEAKVI
jgi:electron transfer flavoprotein beta subunit